MFGCVLQEQKLVDPTNENPCSDIVHFPKRVASTAYLPHSITCAIFATVFWIIRVLALSPNIQSDNYCRCALILKSTREHWPRVCNLRKIPAERIQKLKYSAAVVCASQPTFRTHASVGWHCYIVFKRAHVTINLHTVEFIPNLIEYERYAIIPMPRPAPWTTLFFVSSLNV